MIETKMCNLTVGETYDASATGGPIVCIYCGSIIQVPRWRWIMGTFVGHNDQGLDIFEAKELNYPDFATINATLICQNCGARPTQFKSPCGGGGGGGGGHMRKPEAEQTQQRATPKQDEYDEFFQRTWDKARYQTDVRKVLKPVMDEVDEISQQPVSPENLQRLIELGRRVGFIE